MSDKPVVIIGAGGHAKVVTDALKLSGFATNPLFLPICKNFVFL